MPIIGSKTLFYDVWKKSGIVEDKASGHATCTICGKLKVDLERYKHNPELLAQTIEQKVHVHSACACACVQEACACRICTRGAFDIYLVCKTLLAEVAQG